MLNRASALLALLFLAGCNQLGPSALRNGRALYNRSIIESGDQQTLASIARLRYGESLGMLAVSSVTANIRVRVDASGNWEVWGSSDEVDGNLVPLSAGFAYEENPTISYTPVDGAAYVRELLSPIPIDIAFLLMASPTMTERGMIFALLESVNGLHNPAFHDGPAPADERFQRFVKLSHELGRAGMTSWARMMEQDGEFAFVISRYAPEGTQTVRELLELVDVPAAGVDDGRDIILPVWLSDGTTSRRDGLAVNTRSVFDLLNIASASMDVPPEHSEAGWTEAYPPLGSAAELIRIRCTQEPPERAMVAIQHHGWSFWIDASDTQSKEFFRLLQTLMSMRISEAAKADVHTPLLTVPVSR